MKIMQVQYSWLHKNCKKKMEAWIVNQGNVYLLRSPQKKRKSAKLLELHKNFMKMIYPK